MSYILDALRRADAERQQGQLPGLHAVPSGGAAAAPGAGRLAWGWLVLAALLALAAVVLAVWWWWPAAVPPAPASSAAVAAVPASGGLPVRAPALVPVPVPVPIPVPVPAPLPIVVSAVSPADLRPALPAVAAASKPAAATPAPAVPLSALPPDERRQLPPLVPGGSVWSDSAASRFVILDGMVLREGDAVAPGLTLERIERKAALVRWKDRRIEVLL